MSPWRKGVLLALVMAALALRITGWDRGVAEVVSPESAHTGDTFSFVQYHPDEATLISAALALEDLTRPPLTAYGTLPMYLARIVISGTAAVGGVPFNFETPGGRRLAVYSVRILSILLSMATLVVLWVVTRAAWGETTAFIATVLIAAAPLMVQQAHFYTVDAPFALLGLLSLAAVMRLGQHSGLRFYLVAGLLIGLTAATRLNGLLTAVAFTVAHLTLVPEAGWRQTLGRLRTPNLWWAGLAALGTLIILQPHLLIDPQSMLRSVDTNDFAYSVAIARGDVLRPWSLADTHTISYLHFWTALLPQGAGWPLTLLLAAGWIRAVLVGDRTERLVALWCALLFLTIGGLHTKHVRYLAPLLAPLGMLAAHMLVDFSRRRGWRIRVMGATAACALYTWTYGTAFSRIYQLEDARTTAGDWIRQHVPAAATIAIERGGFSMRGSFSSSIYQEQDLNTTTVFATRGYLTCGAAARYLTSRLESADWVAITDVNRYRQYTAAQDMYPAAASFYTSLLDGDLGFEPTQRFKVYPSVAGLTFYDDDAEPSFLGFDHPAVYIMQQSPEYRQRLAAWQAAAPMLPGCADDDLAEAVAAMQTGDLPAAEAALANARRFTPALAALLQVMVHERRGERELSLSDMQTFSAGADDPSLAGVLLPWATATSLIQLGLVSEAARILELGWERRHSLGSADQEMMAKSYMYVAVQLAEANRADLEERVYLMAADLWESPSTLNPAARLVHDRGAGQIAMALWEKSLNLDNAQIDIHLAAGHQAAAASDRLRALQHLRQAAALALKARTPGASKTIIDAAKGLHLLAEPAEALGYLRQAAEVFPESAALLQATADSLTKLPFRP
ncbi:MAG: glycosyltransferase family 39 protein [bacterium]|nr:glycosyltransferase family 39 protein [bacterium]